MSSRYPENMAQCQLKWMKSRSYINALNPCKTITGRTGVTRLPPAQLLLSILRPSAQSLKSEHWEQGAEYLGGLTELIAEANREPGTETRPRRAGAAQEYLTLVFT